MRSSESYAELRKVGRPLIQTGEAAARLQLSLSSASHLLASLEKEGLVRRIRRGLWALQPSPEPFSVPRGVQELDRGGPRLLEVG